MTLMEWMSQPYEGSCNGPFDADADTILERFAYLVARNGGSMEVFSWGFISSDGGLDQNQALELIKLSGICFGFYEALGPDPEFEEALGNTIHDILTAVGKIDPEECQ